jgi:large subunit ribosomal protein L4
MRHLALKCVLSEKVRGDKLVLLDDLSLGIPSTKSMIEVLRNLDITGSTLIVTGEPQRNLVLSSHNLKRVWTLPVSLINAEQLLKRDSIVMTLDAARWAEKLLEVERSRRRGAGNGSSTAQSEAQDASDGG